MARRGKVLLDQGYGLANRAAHIPNRAETKHGWAGRQQLRCHSPRFWPGAGTSHGGAPNDTICPLPPELSALWNSIIGKMLLDGTSYIPKVADGALPSNSATKAHRLRIAAALRQSQGREVVSQATI